MEFDAKYNEVKFSSGKTKYAFNGVIGIDPSLKRATEGWDGIVYEEGLDTELSKEDLIELADHMIEKSGRCFLCAPVEAHDTLTAASLALLETI